MPSAIHTTHATYYVIYAIAIYTLYRAKIHMEKDKTNYTAPTFKIVSLMRYQEHMHHALIPDICLFCTLPHF